MSSAFVKFNKFVLNSGKAKFNFSSDTLKVMLSNTAPTASTNEVSTDITDISSGNGYTAGGNSVPNLGWSQTSGTATLVGDAVVFTASGGSIASFRYAVVYDSTTGYLVGYFDYGSTVTITSGNTFTVNFNGSATAGTILTLA